MYMLNKFREPRDEEIRYVSSVMSSIHISAEADPIIGYGYQDWLNDREDTLNILKKLNQ